ncbi:MAG TPA: PAS domain S-box protein, partial [Rectinemataceae bacterium]|nr:PAS domain S-box protein [Rectinemataceae bacterium]
MQREVRKDADAEKAPAREIAESLRSLERQRIAPAAIGLSVVYSLRAIYFASPLGGSEMGISALCASTVLFMMMVFLLQKTRKLHGANPRVFIFAMIAVVSSYNFYILASRNDIGQTTLVMLTLIGAGFLTFSTPLFLLEASLILATWGFLSASWFRSPEWGQYSLSLLLGAVLAFTVHRVQIRILSRLEAARLKNESQASALKKALDNAVRGEANFRLLTENSTDLIAKISTEGLCLYVSPACTSLLGYQPEEMIGRHVFDFIHPLERRSVADSIEPEIFLQSHTKIVCRLKRKNGFFGWYESKLQYFSDVETKEIQIVAIARDIGDRIRAERFETVRHAITTIKASETNIEEEFTFLLKTICGALQWEMGEIWLVDEERLLLKRESFWCASSMRLREFASTSASMTFPPGVGLPGTVWSKGTVCLLDDVASAYSSGRKKAYETAGIVSAIGAALVDDSRIYGVMVFLSRREIQRNRELLDMIGAAGAELGNFIGKLRARESFRANSEKLGALVEERTTTIRALQSEVSRQQRLEQDVLMAA